MEDKKLVLIFDDTCAMCSRGINFVDTLSKDLPVRPVSMHSVEGQRYIAVHKLDMNASAYLIDEHGVIKEKEAMAASVLRRAGILGKLLSIPFRIPYVSRMLYAMLAWVRFHTTSTKHYHE